MKIQKKRKTRKSAKKIILRDPESIERATRVLGHSKPPVRALLDGEGAVDVGGVKSSNAEAQSLAENAQRKDAEQAGSATIEQERDLGVQAAKDFGGKDDGAPNEKKRLRRNTGSREELLNAALQLFWEKGYAETSVAEVFARSGVRPGSMYHHFKNKEDLLLGVLDRLAEIMYPALLAPVWEKVSDPIERIFGLLDVYRKGILASNFNYGCPVGRLAVEVSGEMLEVHKKIAMNFEGWSNAVQKCLEDAGPRLPKGMDLKMLSHFVLTVMEGGVMQARSYKSIDPFDQGVAQLRDYFNRLEAQGEAEAMQRGESYWDLQKKKNKQGTDPQ